MTRNVEKIAEGLLARMRLSHAQASVLLDQSSDSETLRVYVFDERAAQQKFDVRSWQGYRVEVVRGVEVKPHQRVKG